VSAAGPIALVAHPDTPAPAVQGVTVSVGRDAGSLVLAYTLAGDLARLSVPPAGAARMGRDLWKHTCFEAFVAASDAAAYHELNLSPSGEWTVLAFRGYRDGGPLADASLAPRLTIRPRADGVVLEAEIALSRLARAYLHGPLRLALTAVVEDRTGTVSYWSLRHPAGRPDFHHADSFALRI
jgi:hypothetical protein